MPHVVEPYRRRCCFWQIHCRKDTYDLVMGECIEAFKRDNPGYARLRITHDFIVRRIALYYLHRIDEHGKEKLEELPS